MRDDCRVIGPHAGGWLPTILHFMRMLAHCVDRCWGASVDGGVRRIERRACMNAASNCVVHDARSAHVYSDAWSNERSNECVAACACVHVAAWLKKIKTV